MKTADDSYRPDIDGLRAVAVLAVVGYHAFPQSLPGGFVGVDVFFVISGFLISGQLMSAASAGTFSFADFYARRIRRIFPALLAVLITVGLAGWWLLFPSEWNQLATHIGASAIFANNVVLWSESGYFDTSSSLKPFVHLWSLGVEEQFYLIWPMLIWWSWNRVRWTTTIAVLVVVSFAINVVTVSQGAVDAAFFLPHTRLWQLAAGSYVAALFRDRRSLQRRTGHALSLIGIGLIVASYFALSRAIAYPGWYALMPTLGAAFVIASGREAVINRLALSNRPMVSIGLISYPLYLWHWPILSFLEITEQGDVSPTVKIVAIVSATVLATLTYLLIERPVRRAFTPVSLPRVQPFIASMATILIIMVTGIPSGRLTPPARTAIEVDAPVRNDLNASVCRKRFPGLGEYCQQFDPDLPVKTALLGDSHAAHFHQGLGRLLRRAKLETLVHLGQTGCPPLLGIERLKQSGDNTCTRVNRAAIDAVVADRSIATVWLSFRGAAATTGITEEGERVADLFRVVDGTATNDAAIREGLRSTIAALQAGGKRVGVLLQVPELGFRVDQCMGRPISIGHRAARVPCAIPREHVLRRQAIYRKLIDDMKGEFGISVYDPLQSLCDDAECQAVADGHMLYFDDNHLGDFGSSFALRAFAP